MPYQCRVERDSVSPAGVRLTSFVIQFPRVVLAETVTHRLDSDTWGDCEVSWCERTTTKDISKNSASSRAIPFEKMVERIKAAPYVPQWSINQKGMQGNLWSDDVVIADATAFWLEARDHCVEAAESLSRLGIHKQDCNRLLEPWAWITQIVTSSRWDNFFALRCHHAAHPAFRTIARMMYLARRKSTPTPLAYGQWHLPFVPPEEQAAFRYRPEQKTRDLPDLIKFSAARCAWLSYENHDRDGTPEQMLRTFDRLVAEVPVHASPAEHQATPTGAEVLHGNGRFSWMISNLTGWIQARKLLPHEEAGEYSPAEDEIASWGLE